MAPHAAVASGDALGQSSEALDCVGLLAATLRREGVPAPTLDRLAALVDGSIDPESFAAAVTAPGGRIERPPAQPVLAAPGSGVPERSARPG